MSYYVDKNLHKYSPVISGGFRNEMSKVELPNKIITFFAILLCSGLFSNNISYIIFQRVSIEIEEKGNDWKRMRNKT